MMDKPTFKQRLRDLAQSLGEHVSTPDGQWTVKGFIDVFRHVYTISADTKVVSKILEIHLFPHLLRFARDNNFRIVMADHQNYYPDLTFVDEREPSVKYAVDLKTSYRLPDNPDFCNGFTLGSHGSYFKERDKRKNIQFPYNDYAGHFCLGVIYSRAAANTIDETRIRSIEELPSIASVMRDLLFFSCEKWEIASDRQGSGNTANIGSIVHIPDILAGNGVFAQLGETWFDDYWMNYDEITVTKDGKQTTITRLTDFLTYRGASPSQAGTILRPSAARQQRDNNA